MKSNVCCPDFGKLRISPGKEAVKSLELIKRRKKSSEELKKLIPFV